MKYKKDILNHELDTSTKKKYISPSLRLCEALSLRCVMNEGPASVGGTGSGTKVEGGGDDELSKRRFYNSGFYSGYDNDY